MSVIRKIHARQILDSRGVPTIEVEISTDNCCGKASVPSGKSTGKYESIELRDNDHSLYNGKSVLKAIDNVNKIIQKELLGVPITDQKQIDQIMIDLDGTPNKSKLGANAILAVSLAAARTASKEIGIPLFQYIGGDDSKILPIPFMNIINGGSHADNSLDFQEYMIVPTVSNSFSESLRMGVEIFHKLSNELSKKGYTTNVGDEGGYAPQIKSDEMAIELLLLAIEKSGYSSNCKIAIDAATSELYNTKNCLYELKNNNKKLSTSKMIEFWEDLVKKYPIISIEDPLSEDDWTGWSKMYESLGHKIQIVGDDIFVTNITKLIKGIENNCANAIIIKMNQIGTLTETLQTIKKSKENNIKTIISHRSGETEDTFISDLSVAVNAGQIKTGSLSRSDRTAKYNQLLRIEEFLGNKKVYNSKIILSNAKKQ